MHNTCTFLERRGWTVTRVGVDKYGMVNPEDVEKALTDETVLVTIMHANNEVGTIQPIAEIATLSKKRGITFHTDAVQSVGKIPVSVDELGVDLLALSGHKFSGSKGVGVLYVRKGTRMRSLIQGGHHESGRRAGTENVQGIVGLGVAAEIAEAEMAAEAKTVGALMDKLQAGILEKIENVYVTFNVMAKRQLRYHQTINFSLHSLTRKIDKFFTTVF